MYRTWHRTQRLHGRITVLEHIRPQGRHCQRLLYRAALSCCLRKRSKHHAIANTGSSPRFACIVTPLVSSIERLTSASRLSRASCHRVAHASVHPHCPFSHYDCNSSNLVPSLPRGCHNVSLSLERFWYRTPSVLRPRHRFTSISHTVVIPTLLLY